MWWILNIEYLDPGELVQGSHSRDWSTKMSISTCVLLFTLVLLLVDRDTSLAQGVLLSLKPSDCIICGLGKGGVTCTRLVRSEGCERRKGTHAWSLLGPRLSTKHAFAWNSGIHLPIAVQDTCSQLAGSWYHRFCKETMVENGRRRDVPSYQEEVGEVLSSRSS